MGDRDRLRRHAPRGGAPPHASGPRPCLDGAPGGGEPRVRAPGRGGRAIRVWGQRGAGNGLALERLGYGRESADPEGGRVRRDPGTGEPDGVLEETALDPVGAVVFQPSTLDALRIVREAVRRYVAAGVTTAQTGYATAEQVRGLTLLSRLGVIPLRLVLWPAMELADERLAGRFEFRSYDERWGRLRAVKLVADGSIQGYTAFLREPYFVPSGDDPGEAGYP